MEKPTSLSVKDFLVRMLSTKMMLPEFVIQAVIAHQCDGAIKALKTNNSVEFSGFGKLIFKQNASVKEWEKLHGKVRVFSTQMNDETLSEKKRHSAEVKLKDAYKDIEYLQPKMYEYTTDNRRVEE